ncbi:hypothetical protein DI291_0155 [Bacillus paralicheniformis]|nr:hypothetical protein DI291_0155 [Bacillus paralicheniformis]
MSDDALLRAMIEIKPKRAVYVSCNPGTLVRDFRVLEDGSCSLLGIKCRPFDQENSFFTKNQNKC